MLWCSQWKFIQFSWLKHVPLYLLIYLVSQTPICQSGITMSWITGTAPLDGSHGMNGSGAEQKDWNTIARRLQPSGFFTGTGTGKYAMCTLPSHYPTAQTLRDGMKCCSGGIPVLTSTSCSWLSSVMHGFGWKVFTTQSCAERKTTEVREGSSSMAPCATTATAATVPTTTTTVYCVGRLPMEIGSMYIYAD